VQGKQPSRPSRDAKTAARDAAALPYRPRPQSDSIAGVPLSKGKCRDRFQRRCNYSGRVRRSPTIKPTLT